MCYTEINVTAHAFRSNVIKNLAKTVTRMPLPQMCK